MTFETLQANYDQIQVKLSEMAERFPWESREAYTTWLAQTYEYAVSSTRILALTAGQLSIDKTFLSNRFIQHAAEEKGHDRLLTNDAKALNVILAEIPVLPEAEAFHKSLYYWIFQGRPTVILGWVLCLEGFAVRSASKIFDRVQEAHGSKSASFLNVHGKEDIAHIERAFNALKPLSSADLADINHGLELYARLYENIYSAIVAKNQSQQRAA